MTTDPAYIKQRGYRKFWKLCKARFPNCHAVLMCCGDVRICRHKDEETCGMEIYSLGNGLGRFAAWKDAAENLWRFQ